MKEYFARVAARANDARYNNRRAQKTLTEYGTGETFYLDKNEEARLTPEQHLWLRRAIPREEDYGHMTRTDGHMTRTDGHMTRTEGFRRIMTAPNRPDGLTDRHPKTIAISR